MSVRQNGAIIAGGNQIDNVPTSGSTNPVSSGGVYDALAHVVIEFQEPNAGNNYTWYRKYKDGWVEQGGQHVPATSSDIDHASNQITLPVTMADTHYSILTSQVADTGGTSYYEHESLARRTSTTTISVCFFGQTSNTTTIQWQVSGKMA